MTLHRSLATLTAAGALVVGLGTTSADAQQTIRLSHLNPAGPTLSHSGAMAAVFKSLVEAGTNGSVQVQLFPDGQLGTDDEVIQQTRDGVIQSNISSAGGVAAHYPLVGVFDMPFAFPNIAVAHDVIDLENPFGQKLAEDIQEATGLRVIGVLDSGGFFAISNSRRPIQSVEDMEGLRIRTMTLPTHEAIISSLGGQPTPLPWPEVYTALQTGVADGQMNPIPIMAFARFDEVQGYLTLTNHIITPYVWFMNQDFYDGLTEEEQRVVDWAARAATDAGRGISRIIEASDQGLPKLAEGMEVNALSAEERERFAAAAQPAVRDIIADRLGEAGVEMLDAMLEAIEASPYR